MGKSPNADRIGIITSILCAIHCVLVPLFFSSMPFLGLELLENKVVETVLIFTALVAGGAAFRHNYLHHRHKLPVVMFVTGFFCLVLNQCTKEDYFLVLIPVSASLIITAHYLNIRFSNRQKKQHTEKLYAV